MAEPWCWEEADDGHELRGDGRVLAVARSGRSMGSLSSPRPYLHPLRTRGGRALTAVAPDDHPHHHGLSFAVSDVNGSTFWGGRTYVPGTGSTLLDNHGRQVIERQAARAGALEQDLAWRSTDGTELLRERRVLEAAGSPDGWELTWSSTLTPVAADLRITSSATRGRAGAGYGGIFWRFGADAAVLVSCADGDGEDLAHGSLSPWLRLTDRGAGWQVTLTRTGPELPWFVRADGYVGAGPAIAWTTPCLVPQGSELELGLTARMVDLDD